MFGSVEQAELALMNELPIIGEGSARLAYMGEDGIVYKVEIEDCSNQIELDTLRDMRNMELPEIIGIPKFNSFIVGDHIVIAMEFIDGETLGECFCHEVICECEGVIPENILKQLRLTGLNDFCYGNVIVKDDKYFIIDWEC